MKNGKMVIKETGKNYTLIVTVKTRNDVNQDSIKITESVFKFMYEMGGILK